MGTIANSYATGEVTGTGGAIGGLAGWNRNTIEASYATGKVSGNGAGREWIKGVGGLLGSNDLDDAAPLVNASYSTGPVFGFARA